MDVMEKLVELLGGCPCESDCEGMVGSCPNRKNGYCNEILKLSYCSVSKLAQHLITHGVTVQEWISVDDRLPEPFESVLVFRDGKITIDHHEENGWFAYDFNGKRATHWMPIPKPPKGE